MVCVVGLGLGGKSGIEAVGYSSQGRVQQENMMIRLASWANPFNNTSVD